MIDKFTILGERCSGTNILRALMLKNFELKFTEEYGHRHFQIFHNNFENSDDCLFVSIIRNPFDWINSLYLKPWHLSYETAQDNYHFLNHLFFSKWPSYERRNTKLEHMNVDVCNNRERLSCGYEIEQDVHLITNKKYKNILECRYDKINFMQNVMPKKVKNHILIRYEDLINDFDYTMFRLRTKFKLISRNVGFEKEESYKGRAVLKKGNYIKYKPTSYTEFPAEELKRHNYFDMKLENSFNYV